MSRGAMFVLGVLALYGVVAIGANGFGWPFRVLRGLLNSNDARPGDLIPTPIPVNPAALKPAGTVVAPIPLARGGMFELPRGTFEVLP